MGGGPQAAQAGGPAPVHVHGLTLGNWGAAQEVRQREEKKKKTESETRGQRGCQKDEEGEGPRWCLGVGAGACWACTVASPMPRSAPVVGANANVHSGGSPLLRGRACSDTAMKLSPTPPFPPHLGQAHSPAPPLPLTVFTPLAHVCFEMNPGQTSGGSALRT